MSSKRGSVFGVLILCMVLLGPVTVQAQGNGNGNGGRRIGTSLETDVGGGLPTLVAALQAQLDQALATIAQLQAALNGEITARQSADTTLQNNINALGGAGVTQAVLDAAIAAEAGLRSTADAALEGQIDTEADARAEFDATLEPLTALAPLATYVTIDTGTVKDLAGPHVIFTGVNVHIRSGHVSGDSYTQNGKGNLVLGYNEPSDASLPAERGGSHNVVVGPNHRYNFGVGFVVGGMHRLGADGASVSGGLMNTAGALSSSVSGGFSNIASGQYSHVSAGARNASSGGFSSVTGGADNIAIGNTAAISAGQMNTASGTTSSVSGGFNNTASATSSTVGGGSGNVNATANTFVP